jgi:hypothetical protein
MPETTHILLIESLLACVNGRRRAAISADRALALLFEKIRPRHDLRIRLYQASALALGHTAPNTEFDLVVKRICGAFVHHWAVAADRRGISLGSAANKELIGITRPAQCFRNPLDPLLRVDTSEFVPR